jgi:hypothetical protein
MNELSRLALKIVVGAREQGTGNREQGTGNTEESFGRFYFSSHTFKFFSPPTYVGWVKQSATQHLDNFVFNHFVGFHFVPFEKQATTQPTIFYLPNNKPLKK